MNKAAEAAEVTEAAVRRRIGADWIRWGVMMAVVLAGWVWSAGRSDARVEGMSSLPEQVSRHEIRISVIESQMTAQGQTLRRIEDKLNEIGERQQRELGRSGM